MSGDSYKGDHAFKTREQDAVKMGLQYSTVFVALADLDGESLVPFYQQVFDQEPNIHIPGVYAEFQLSGLRLGIFRPKDSHQTEFNKTELDHRSPSAMSLCIEVKNLQAAIDHLTQLGYPPPGEIIAASHGQEIYAYDPAGNRLILHEASH